VQLIYQDVVAAEDSEEHLRTSTMTITDVDAVVVGAGLSGIYQTYSLLKLGLSVKTLEKGQDVGGTWLWNKYPGAVSDTWSHLYRYSWDREDLLNYQWKDTYLDAADILAYLRHVVQKHDLRRHMTFDTTVRKASWLEGLKVWRVESSSGTYHTRYFVTALGLLSEPHWPNIENRDVYRGSLVHTSRWPNLSLAGKRVGIIGNGSTGIQVITEIAPVVKSLTCFQRHPQYSVPSGRKTVTSAEREALNQDWPARWYQAQTSASGLVHPEATISAFSVSEEEREAIYEAAWSHGNGIHMLFGTFKDLTTSEAANVTLCDFIRRKIATIVADPVKREALMPTELYTHRPISDTGGYYARFNLPHVNIVSTPPSNPITSFTETGLQLADGSVHESLDIIICATGFAAFDGAYSRVDIVGRDHSTTLHKSWMANPKGLSTNMGVQTHGYPNLFMLLGPLSPLSNVPPMAEAAVEFITAAIAKAEGLDAGAKVHGAHIGNGINGVGQGRKDTATKGKIVETTIEGQDAWRELCNEIGSKLLFGRSESYLFGANSVAKQAVEGSAALNGNQTKNKVAEEKAKSPLVFFGGLNMYRQKLRECAENDFVGFSYL
jgi:cyclohexanone monooxygenase